MNILKIKGKNTGAWIGIPAESERKKRNDTNGKSLCMLRGHCSRGTDGMSSM